MPLCDDAVEILKADFGIQPTMSNFGPPGHSRIRRTLARAFSTRRMRVLEPIILQRCREILDAFAERGAADLARELCYPLPALTIFAMIGFPDEDADQIKEWCADKLVVNWGRLSAEAQVRAARTMVAFWKYCVAYVERRRFDPGDNLVADLMQDPDVAEPLTDDEISSIIFGLSFAGHETTTNQLANASGRFAKTICGGNCATTAARYQRSSRSRCGTSRRSSLGGASSSKTPPSAVSRCRRAPGCCCHWPAPIATPRSFRIRMPSIPWAGAMRVRTSPSARVFICVSARISRAWKSASF